MTTEQAIILLAALVGIVLMCIAFYVGLRARWRVLDALEEIRRAERETWNAPATPKCLTCYGFVV